jgi:predicted glycoside hydrolase/deacetylase ChbG (UPF0249 family)
MPLLVIVNADDLGLNQHVNDAIFELMEERRVSSATLMANGPALADAIDRLKKFPNCSFGAHLNLTQLEPVAGGPGARLLVSDTGQMSRAIESASPTPARLRAMYDELCAQVTRLTQLGVSISHFDSHHHVHTKPQVLPVLKAVQKRFGIRTVRISKNLYSSEQPCPTTVFWGKIAFNSVLRYAYRTCTTDLFTDLMTCVKVKDASWSSAGTIELMVHPGAPNDSEETTILRSDWLTRLPDAKLISYSELCRGTR